MKNSKRGKNISVLLESFSTGFTNVSRCFLDEIKTSFQVSVWLHTGCLHYSLVFRPLVKRNEDCGNEIEVWCECRWEFERSLFVGPHQRLHSSKLKSCACADNAPLPDILISDTHVLHGYLSKGFSCAVSGSRHQYRTSYLGKSAWLWRSNKTEGERRWGIISLPVNCLPSYIKHFLSF